MPGLTWARVHARANAARKYNILGWRKQLGEAKLARNPRLATPHTHTRTTRQLSPCINAVLATHHSLTRHSSAHHTSRITHQQPHIIVACRAVRWGETARGETEVWKGLTFFWGGGLPLKREFQIFTPCQCAMAGVLRPGCAPRTHECTCHVDTVHDATWSPPSSIYGTDWLSGSLHAAMRHV